MTGGFTTYQDSTRKEDLKAKFDKKQYWNQKRANLNKSKKGKKK